MSRVSEIPVAAKAPQFDSEFRERLRDLLKWRRDVRRFKRTKLPEGTIERLIATACIAPSVGLSEPWRFVIVEDEARRAAIRSCFEDCNCAALDMQSPDRAALYARLKLAGLRRAVPAFRVRRSLDRARWRARAPHHAGDARLLGGHRNPHAVARRADRKSGV